MSNLTGLVIARGKRSHDQLVAATRAAFVAAGYREAADGTVRVRIGDWIDDHALITDSSIVTFDAAVAKALAAVSCGALFAMRDYGYRSGKRNTKGAFLAIDGVAKWKRKPKRANHADDIRRVIEGLGVMPEPWHVESRDGTTLVFAPPSKPELFPPRDTPERRTTASTNRIHSMIANLRPDLSEQGPPDCACQTMKHWLPAKLPERSEAVLACVTDPARRASAWSSLSREVWGGDLALDARNAKLLMELAGDRGGIAIERAVLWLCARVLERDEPPLDDEALLNAAYIAVNHGRRELIANLDVASLAADRLGDKDMHLAARAAAVLAALDPMTERADVAERASRDRAFATHIGFSRAFRLATAGDFPAAFALWDAVQPHVRGEAQDVQWTHASILWATWATLGTPSSPPDRARRRLELALELAPDHEPTQHNAAELRKPLGDPAPTSKPAAKKRRT